MPAACGDLCKGVRLPQVQSTGYLQSSQTSSVDTGHLFSTTWQHRAPEAGGAGRAAGRVVLGVGRRPGGAVAAADAAVRLAKGNTMFINT